MSCSKVKLKDRRDDLGHIVRAEISMVWGIHLDWTERVHMHLDKYEIWDTLGGKAILITFIGDIRPKISWCELFFMLSDITSMYKGREYLLAERTKE